MELPNGKKIELGPRAKIIAGAVFGLMLAILVLDRFVLIGKRVDGVSISLRREAPGTLTIKEVGKKHLVEIMTSRMRTRKNDKGMTLTVRLEDPKGNEVYESSEWIRRKKRYFSFTPQVAGDYKITVKRTGVLIGPTRGLATVIVRVGDKRFFMPLLDMLPF